MESGPIPYDYIITGGPADVVVSIGRQPGLDAEGDLFHESLAGNMLPRLCNFAGAGACRAACQAPEGYQNEANDCATQNGRELFEAIGVNRNDVRLAKVCGSAAVAFTDRDQPSLNAEGYLTYQDVDAVVGDSNTVKACRLADCGLLVVTGTSREGRQFDGFIHATRNNLNGNDQFVSQEGEPIGGVTKMLCEIRTHYAPLEMQVELVAGIAPQLYLFDFTPSAQDLQDNPGLTAQAKRESLFKGWFEAGWIAPYVPATAEEKVEWDGKTYQIDIASAIRSQVEAAGLGESYTENVRIDGNLITGHASNRGGKKGRVVQARDFYAVVPYDYIDYA